MPKMCGLMRDTMSWMFSRGDRIGMFDMHHRCVDRAAIGVTHHQHQAGAERAGGKFDAAHQRGRNHIARDPDDEQIAKALIENNFRRRAAIGTA